MCASLWPRGPNRFAGRVSGAGARSLVALALTLVLAGPASAQLRGPVTIQQGAQEATIVADEIQQIGGPPELLIAEGNVEVTQGTSRLLADRVELNRDTGEAVAQGRVVFFDGQDRLVGNRVDYNLKTGTGIVYDASTFSAPYYHLSAERMGRVGGGHPPPRGRGSRGRVPLHPVPADRGQLRGVLHPGVAP